LIDSAQAGLRVLIKGGAPDPTRSTNGFVAHLNHLSPAMLRLAD